MNPAPTFDRVYRALRALIMTGPFPPGRRLDPAMLGEELHSSITPIRDALYRLMGEGLVAPGAKDGFAVPHLSERDLRHLYAWNLQVLVLALSLAPPDHGLWSGVERAFVGGMSAADRSSTLFGLIAEQSGNREHPQVMAGLNARMARVRRAELVALVDAEPECAALVNEILVGSHATLRKSLTRYHDRRLRAVPEIIEVTRQD
jgi:DNA-binding FadR family transcriptional regulator